MKFIIESSNKFINLEKDILRVKNLRIEQVSSAIPSQICSNIFFEQYRTKREINIFEKTVGIKERRWTRLSETSNTQLALASCISIFKNVDVKNIRAVLYISQTPDQLIPFVSNIIQSEYKLSKSTICYDLNLGCAGFVQGLYLAASLLNGFNIGDKVLIVCSETLSKILDLNDNSTNMIFGDGAASVLVGKDQESICYFNIFSDGNNWKAIRTKKTNQNQDILYMNGSDVFDFTIREISTSIENLLFKSEINKNDIDYFVLHQANSFILNQIASQLGIENKSKIINQISHVGNTSSVSIPLALSNEFTGKNLEGHFLFSGFGSGLNWANCAIKLKDTFIHPIKEV